ncbi:uncharacterized protein LOC132185077 [Corylus avellana]|uniref:uncharacterized protein LOC132185077 n=1 Tax=Corylus avellana TaxID=13451 RepID=UPI00286B7175|nr:uncharacterized protein LOC132185077 [Corylus avellana]
MESLNNSLLVRLGWKMTSNQSLLWVDSLRSKYLKNGISFLNAPTNPSSSWLWKGLLKNRKVVEKGACISISSGLNVDIWSSPWIPLMPNFRPIPNANLDVCPSLTVADLIIPGEQGRPSPLHSEAWLLLWGLKLQARLKHLLWKVAWDILPSRAKISRFVVSDDPAAWVCPFCKGPLETLSHLFLESNLPIALWSSSPWQISTSRFAIRPISVWISAILSPMASFGIPKPKVRKFQLFATLVMDFIWRARNLLIHDGLQPSSSQAIVQVSSSLNHRITAWRELDLPTLWMPPVVGFVKRKF